MSNDQVDTTTGKRSPINYLSVLTLCVTSAFLTASVVLIFQYKSGIPYSLFVSLMLAAVTAFLVPILATLIFLKFKPDTPYGGYITFLLSNLTISLVIGALIF